MKPILYYLLQLMVASGLLYGYYHFFLRNKKFHRYNRFYLLFSIAISLLIPFLNIPIYFTAEETQSSFVLQTLTQISFSQPIEINISSNINEPIKQNWFTWQNLSYLFYILIAFIVLLRVFISLQKIRNIIHNHTVEKLQRINFVNTNEPGTPFSFFKWLFWNDKIELRSAKGEQVFRHELFHIQQKHSWDILFMEIITVIFWINPFFYLMKKELKAIHEFLADEYAINANEKWQYAELLLMQALNTQIHLTNPFFHNQIKRRIAMITSSSRPKYQYIRKLLVLPIAAVVLGLFAFKYKEKKERVQRDNKVEVPAIDTTPKPHSKRMTFYSHPEKIALEADTLIFKEKPYKTKIDLAKCLVIINGQKTNNKILSTKTIISKQITFYPAKYPEAIKKYGNEAQNGALIFEGAQFLDIKPEEYYKEDFVKTKSNWISYKVFEKVEIEPSFPGGDQAWKRYLEINLQSFNPSKNGAPKGAYTAYVQFVVDENGNISDVIPLTKHGYGMEEKVIEIIKKGPKWVPAKQNGKIVKAYRKQPVTFEIIGKDNIKIIPTPIIDGKGNVEKEVVVVQPEISTTEKINEVTLSDTSHPLLVINGKEQLGLKISQLEQKVSVNDIESISILKGSNAIQKYGPKGKDGVIEITTKQNKNVKINEITLTDKNSNDNKVFEKVEIEPSFPGGKESWNRNLQKHLADFNPADKGAPQGKYSVVVQFIVHKDGHISDIKALTHFGYEMEEKAIELIKKGPKWEPAIQNGYKVTAYKKQIITFEITENPNEPTTLIKDYNDPNNWNPDDPEFLKWRHQAISEIISIARKEGKAAYFYKGRTYVFAHIDGTQPENVNTYFESDGSVKQFILNGKIIRSINQINSQYLRKDIKDVHLLFPKQAKEKFNIDGSILEIETYDFQIISKSD